MISLARPHVRFFESWSAAVDEFDGVHIDGAGWDRGAVADRAGLEVFVAKAELYARPGAELPEGHVPCEYFWVTDGDEVVGFIAFRRELNDWLRNYAGHIGYAVRPTARRRGIAATALQLLLDHAREQGYQRVMLTCDDENVGSYRTIEGAGGELTGTVPGPDGEGITRQYWIAL